MARGAKTGGRRKGTPNKLTAIAREAFEFAFAESGGAQELASWAKENRTEFYKLYARLVPEQKDVNLNAQVTVEIVDPTRRANTASK